MATHQPQRAAFWLSLVALGHFSLAAIPWTLAVYFGIRERWVSTDWFQYFLRPAMSFLILFPSCVLCLVMTIRRSRQALLMTAVLYLLSAAFFVHDVSNERWQVSIGVATPEYWDSGGRKNTYFTWWWYNDRWLMSQSTAEEQHRVR